MARGWRPRDRGKNVDHPNLFDWAESVAARLRRTLEDVSRLSTTGAPVVFGVLLSGWLTTAEGSTARHILAIATAAVAILVVLAWSTAALQGRLTRKGVPILLHGIVLVGLCGTLFSVVGSLLMTDLRNDAERVQAAVRAKAEEQQKKQEDDRRLEQERVAQREGEERRLAEIEALEKACTETNKRDLDMATKAQRNARKVHRRMQDEARLRAASVQDR